MTSKPSSGHRSELDRAGDPETPSTLRSIEAADPISTETESPALPLPLYYEPQPLVPATDHKTIEVETIKLAEDIDPRKLPTQLRLGRPGVVPPDSGWPQADVVVVSSQPPLAGRRRWRAPLVLLVLLGAIVLLVLARAAAQRSHAGVQAASALPPRVASVPVVEAVNVPNPTPPLAAPAILETPAVDVAPPSSAPATLSARAEKRTHPAQGTAKSNHHSSDPAPTASSRALAAPSASKPKRAIY